MEADCTESLRGHERKSHHANYQGGWSLKNKSLTGDKQPNRTASFGARPDSDAEFCFDISL